MACGGYRPADDGAGRTGSSQRRPGAGGHASCLFRTSIWPRVACSRGCSPKRAFPSARMRSGTRSPGGKASDPIWRRLRPARTLMRFRIPAGLTARLACWVRSRRCGRSGERGSTRSGQSRSYCSRAKSRQDSASAAWVAGRCAGACHQSHSRRSRTSRATRSRRFALKRGFRASFQKSSFPGIILRRSSSCTSSKGRCSSNHGTPIGIVTAIAATGRTAGDLGGRGRPRRGCADERPKRCVVRRGSSGARGRTRGAFLRQP